MSYSARLLDSVNSESDIAFNGPTYLLTTYMLVMKITCLRNLDTQLELAKAVTTVLNVRNLLVIRINSLHFKQ
jgi:hypothetical protein